jgi:hypothetical protein
MAGKNKCPECGNRMKYFKCHVCGFRHTDNTTIIIENKNRKMKR